MQSYKKQQTILAVILCIATTPSVHTASWFRSGKQKITQATLDKSLSDAITNNDNAETAKLLMQGANPNAKPDGHTSLFVQSFEYALIRDENNIIVGIDQHQADIARKLANFKAKFSDLERDLASYINKTTGQLRQELFQDAHVAQEFNTLVTHLKNITASPHGLIKKL